MVVHAEGRHPGYLHDGGEMREIEIAAEKRGQANCKTRPRCEERDPARKRARQNQRGDCPGECDVNGPGDDQGALKRLKGYNVREARVLRVLCVR